MRSGIPIKRFEALKSYLSSENQAFLPATNDFKSFSGSIRKWLKDGPLKLCDGFEDGTESEAEVATNKKWVGITDGKAFLYYLVKVFVREGIISKEYPYIYLKVAYDKRISVDSIPTIISISITGKHLSPENCITITGFSTDEAEALKHPLAWKAIFDLLSLEYVTIDQVCYSVRVIFSPDLCATRETVCLEPATYSRIQEIWKYQQIALALHAYIVGDRDLFSKFMRTPSQRAMNHLSGWYIVAKLCNLIKIENGIEILIHPEYIDENLSETQFQSFYCLSDLFKLSFI